MTARLFDIISKTLFLLIAMALVAMSLALVVAGVWETVANVVGGGFGAFSLLNSIGLIIVSVAIIDLSKFIIDEYVFHTRELRAAREARQSLTKFMTIIIIAFALEALVAAFEVAREKMFETLLYPAGLMVTAVLALVGLGAFQWLTRAAEREMPEGPTASDEEDVATARKQPSANLPRAHS